MLLNRLNDWVLILLSLTILISIAALGWWDLIDGKLVNPVLEFGTRSTGVTHMTEKSIYHPGEMVYARVLVQKNRSVQGVIQWHLVNGEMRTFPSRPGSLPVGIYDALVKVEIIPDDMHLNKEYWFCGSIVYKINWLANLTYNLWTNKFKVVKKGK